MQDMSGQQIRQQIDTEQVYATYRDVRKQSLRRFSGSMTWKVVHGRRYLYRKVDGTWKSLGPESESAQEAYDSFRSGRADLKAREKSLDRELRAMAPVNRAMALGRVPVPSARVLRRLERDGVLGKGLRVVGTHAMFAYERMGGVHFGSDAIATQDIDLLYDARGALNLMASEMRGIGLLGVLQKIDSSFALTEAESFRAANAKGFMVDLITPSIRRPATRVFNGRIAGVDDDLVAAEIDGLTWLESSPMIERAVIDERGYPLTIVAPDPRAFVSHKLWIAQRDDRDPAKRRRDAAQAKVLAEMLVSRLPGLRFDDPALNAVPKPVRQLGCDLARTLESAPPEADDWDG